MEFVNKPKPAGGAVTPSKRKRSGNSNQCFAFKKGNCEKGSECKFKHGGNEPKESTGVQQTNQPQQRRQGDRGRGGSNNQPPQAQGQARQQQQLQPRLVTSSVRNDEKVGAGDAMDVVEAPLVNAGGKAYMTQELFSALPISPLVKRALAEVMKYANMTQVQVSTLPVLLSGRDCLAKAKTGTGKTLAFLIPSIERMLQAPPARADKPISTLILSPTRELAMQIAKEAELLLHFAPAMKTLCLVGGTNMKKDVRLLNEGAVAILVASPGRLLDHLENTPGISERLRLTQTVILDEADNLLDMGFKPTIDKIFQHLPPRDARQTLLFSATVPPAVQQVAKHVLQPGYEVVDTVGSEVAGSQTHVHVKQEVATVSMDDMIPAVVSVLQREINRGGNYKVIVFFSTARVTGYMAALFEQLQCPVMEIHSRKSQSARIKTSEQFRDATKAIMFSSDVSARGMDYPDVSFVLQVGLTDKEQYTHRLGRTARAGKGGAGMLLLMDVEARHMLRSLHGMPLEEAGGAALQLDKYRAVCREGVQRVLRDSEGRKAAEQAYGAWLGFYNGNKKNCGSGWNNAQLVEAANLFSLTLGFSPGEPPALEKKTVGKMGLKGVPGLRLLASSGPAGYR